MKYISQIVFISAILPQDLLTLLEDRFNINQNKIIQGSTTRNNINYNIISNFDNSKITELTIVEQLLREKIYPNLRENDKAIIFTSTHNSVEYISKQFKILGYHAKMENKAQVLEDFINKSANKVIVGTTALEVGLDIPGIRFSIHVNKVNGLTSLEQGIGRIGRDGRPSVAYIIANLAIYRPKKLRNTNLAMSKIEDFRDLDFNKLVEFINSQKCCRIILESYFNNKSIECCIEPMAKCYICQQHDSILQ